MKKLVLLALSIIATAIPSIAQELPMRQAQQFRVAAYRLMQKYERQLQWVNNGEDDRESFCDLFVSPDAEVYNDLLGFSDADRLDVETYSSILADKARQISVVIKDLNMKSINPEDGKWVMDVTFDKKIEYKNDCNILLKSDRYFGDDAHQVDYNMIAHLVYDPVRGRCLISKIDGSVKSDKQRFGSDYVVINMHDTKDRLVTLNEKNIEFDNNMSIWPNLDVNTAVVYFPDPDFSTFLVKDMSKCDRIYFLQYKTKKFRVRPWFSASLGDFYAVTTNTNYNFRGIKSSATEFGLDFGYTFPTLSKVKVSMMLGAGLSQSSMTLDMTANDFSYQTSEDIDRDTYERRYRDIQLEQEESFTDIVVPAYFELEFMMSRSVSMFVDLGAKVYAAMSNKTKSLTGSYKVDGLYSQYDNLVLGEEAGINGFTNSGTIELNQNRIPEFERKKITPDVFGRIGLRCRLYKTLYLDASGGYQRSIGDCYTNTTYVYPFEYQVQSGENVNMFRTVTNISREAINISVGLTYKF